MAVVWIVSIVFGVMGANGANKGTWYRYPVNVDWVK
ncbi:DUF4870 domain-containing protein [Nocardiopsis tropica]|nr:DUF4870 domain-containing protein [Nocardiopsis tropica]